MKYLPPQILESQAVLTQEGNIAHINNILNAMLNDIYFKELENKMNALLEMNFIFEYKQVSKFEKSKKRKIKCSKYSSIIININKTYGQL